MGQVVISGTTYDVYGTEAGLKAYMAARIGADKFDAATSVNRKKAHVSATRWLDRQTWAGAKKEASQALEFPRTGLTDKDGNAVDDTTVPAVIESACYELVLILLDDATKQESEDSGSNIRSVKAGSVSVEFFKGTLGQSSKFPSHVNELIRCFLEGYSTFNAAVGYGTSVESEFDDDYYDMNGGLA